jgi:hypothetical protein
MIEETINLLNVSSLSMEMEPKKMVMQIQQFEQQLPQVESREKPMLDSRTSAFDRKQSYAPSLLETANKTVAPIIQTNPTRNSISNNRDRAKVKELISYAAARNQSKDKRKKQNAVHNLATTFEHFKSAEMNSQDHI